MVTRKSGSEMSTKAALLYVKYEEAEVCRSAIMQDFWNNEGKNLNDGLAAILDIICAKFVMG